MPPAALTLSAGAPEKPLKPPVNRWPPSSVVLPELVWTSGATESNNLAIKGVAKYWERNKGGPGHIITPLTEHSGIDLARP